METLPIIDVLYKIYKTLFEVNRRLPKQERYTLGASAEESILECLGRVISAKNAPRHLKASYLIQAQSHLEIATLKFRLLLELELANETILFQLQAKAAEAGRQIGGWLRSL